MKCGCEAGGERCRPVTPTLSPSWLRLCRCACWGSPQGSVQRAGHYCGKQWCAQAGAHSAPSPSLLTASSSLWASTAGRAQRWRVRRRRGQLHMKHMHAGKLRVERGGLGSRAPASPLLANRAAGSARLAVGAGMPAHQSPARRRRRQQWRRGQTAAGLQAWAAQQTHPISRQCRSSARSKGASPLVQTSMHM